MIKPAIVASVALATILISGLAMYEASTWLSIANAMRKR